MQKRCVFGLLLFLGCGGESPPSAEGLVCDKEHDGWEECVDGEVRWCHAFGTPHFHSGAKCQLAGLACSQLTERVAACTDPATTCVAGEFRCDGNTAVNCVEGVAALQPCGTLRVCLADPAAGVATCFDDREEAVCGGFGELYASGCVCNDGYRSSGGAEEVCVPG